MKKSFCSSIVVCLINCSLLHSMHDILYNPELRTEQSIYSMNTLTEYLESSCDEDDHHVAIVTTYVDTDNGAMERRTWVEADFLAQGILSSQSIGEYPDRSRIASFDLISWRDSIAKQSWKRVHGNEQALLHFALKYAPERALLGFYIDLAQYCSCKQKILTLMNHLDLLIVDKEVGNRALFVRGNLGVSGWQLDMHMKDFFSLGYLKKWKSQGFRDLSQVTKKESSKGISLSMAIAAQLARIEENDDMTFGQKHTEVTSIYEQVIAEKSKIDAEVAKRVISLYNGSSSDSSGHYNILERLVGLHSMLSAL